jgi:hypothetical protein
MPRSRVSVSISAVPFATRLSWPLWLRDVWVSFPPCPKFLITPGRCEANYLKAIRCLSDHTSAGSISFLHPFTGMKYPA